MNRKRKLLIYGGDSLDLLVTLEMAYSARIPLVVFLHAEKPEMQTGKYNEQGRRLSPGA